MERSAGACSSHAFRDAVLRGYAEADLPKPPTKEETTVSSPKILRALEIAQAIIENKEPPPYTEEEEEEEEGEEEEIDPLELLAPAPAPLPAKQQSSSRRPSISRGLPRLVEERAPASSQTPSQPTRPETVTTMNDDYSILFNLQGLDATAWPSMPSTAQTYRSVMTPPKYYGPPPVRRPIDPNVTPNPTNANELMHCGVRPPRRGGRSALSDVASGRSRSCRQLYLSRARTNVWSDDRRSNRGEGESAATNRAARRRRPVTRSQARKGPRCIHHVTLRPRHATL